MAVVTDVTTGEAFDREVAQNELTIAYFWAPWSGPCKHMNAVVAELAKATPPAANARFVRVEAEEVDAATERCGVAAVPCFVLMRRGGREVARVEGADAAGLTAAVEAACGTGGGAGAAAAAGAAAGAAAAGAAAAATTGTTGDAANAELRAQLARRRVEALVRGHPVVLFMKGTPDAPRCGFSRRVVDALAAAGASPAPPVSAAPAAGGGHYAHFDVLSDESVREAVKVFADWPTIPQLYVSGEFLGGCDIVEEMAASGELKEALKAAAAVPSAAAAAAPATAPAGPPPPPPAPSASAQQPPLTPELRAQIEALLASKPLVLFMKGTPDAPRCGFSRRVVDALAAAGAPPAGGYAAVDILAHENQAVREGLKVLSDWPTYPQLYSKGELVGGCDIVEEMAGAGELAAVVRDALSA